MLSTALGFRGDMSYGSVLVLEVRRFFQGLLPPLSKGFVKLYIIVCFWILYKIWSKDDSYIIEFYYLPIFRKRLKEREGEIKNRKPFLNFTFDEDSCLLSNFTRSNSNKSILVQVFWRCDIVIFNNNLLFCMLSSFCSIARVAGCILAREIIKWINVFYLRCLKMYCKKLDKHTDLSTVFGLMVPEFVFVLIQITICSEITFDEDLYHVETSQLIFIVIQLSGFYMTRNINERNFPIFCGFLYVTFFGHLCFRLIELMFMVFLFNLTCCLVTIQEYAKLFRFKDALSCIAGHLKFLTIANFAKNCSIKKYLN